MAKPSGMEAKPSAVGAKPSGTREAPTPDCDISTAATVSPVRMHYGGKHPSCMLTVTIWAGSYGLRIPLRPWRWRCLDVPVVCVTYADAMPMDPNIVC